MNSNLTEKSLVLVVGAGASNEVKLPVGSELKTQIAKELDIQYDMSKKISGDDIIDRSLSIMAPKSNDFNPFLEAAQRVRDAMPQAISIDNFIDSHRSDSKISKCGKLAIARCILKAESNSLLRIDRQNTYNKLNFEALEPTWLNAFFQLLTENCQQADLPQRFSKVGIICFNYDRCIEHFLYCSLQNYYFMQPDVASEVLTHLEIYHPYGMVGKLPWQGGENEGFEFGGTPTPMQLLSLADQLRTFTEGIDSENSHISGIRKIFSSASRIAFLGFAFHRLNIELLFTNHSNNDKSCPVYATAHGISETDIEIIKQDVLDGAGINRNQKQIHFRSDLKCSQLFSEFGRSLSLQ